MLWVYFSSVFLAFLVSLVLFLLVSLVLLLVSLVLFLLVSLVLFLLVSLVLLLFVSLLAQRFLVCHGHIRPSFADRTLCFPFFTTLAKTRVVCKSAFAFRHFSLFFGSPADGACVLRIGGFAESGVEVQSSTEHWWCAALFIMNEYMFRGSAWSFTSQSVFPNEPLNVYGKYSGLWCER